MSLLDVLRYRWRALSRPNVHEEEVAEELDFHLELEAMQRAHAAHGTLSPEDARYAARRRLGNATYYREETRRISGITFLDTVQQDVRFALRSFRRTPTFTAIAIVTLAVGIGANTAMFSAIDALLLQPLQFREPDRLMSISLTRPGPHGGPIRDDIPWSSPKFELFRAAQDVFADETLWMGSQFTVRVTDEAVRVFGEFVDSHYLPTLGIQPAMGRGFFEAEDHDLGGARVAVLSHRLWEDLFSADSTALGRTIDVDGMPYTVVGVAPPTFRGLSGQAALWMPMASSPSGWGLTNPTAHNYFAVARLAPAVSIPRAMAVVAALGTRVDATFPDPKVASVHWGAAMHPLDSARLDGRARQILVILFAAVGLVLLIACANVANLFLVRASGRRREISVRLAIGAGRWRLVRQLLIESVLLSLAGGVASLVVAWGGTRLISDLHPASALRMHDVAGVEILNYTTIHLNVAAFVFAAIVAIATGILFGLVPALQATNPSLSESLKDDGAARTIRIRGLTSRNVLTVVEIALAVVLLAGSGLMLRSLGRLLAVHPGFDADHVLVLRTNRAPLWSRDSISRFYDVAIERVSRIPGVTGVGMADCPPLVECTGMPVVFPDRPPAPPGAEAMAGVHWITPGWPTVVHVPLVRGRMFTRDDVVGRRRVVLVSETAARTFWPNQDAIGRPVSVGGPDTAYVAGIVGDVSYGPLDAAPRPDVYVSYYQAPLSFRMMLFVRTRVDPSSLANAVRVALREVAPGFPVYDVRPLDDHVRDATDYARVSAQVLALFAALALALAMIGTYGVIAFAVSQRTREIGVRIALGATSADVVRLVVGQGLALGAAGGAIGLTAAIALTRSLRSLLYGIEPTDTVTLVGIVAILVLAVIVASWMPARRAAGVPAMHALRGS